LVSGLPDEPEGDCIEDRIGHNNPSWINFSQWCEASHYKTKLDRDCDIL